MYIYINIGNKRLARNKKSLHFYRLFIHQISRTIACVDDRKSLSFPLPSLVTCRISSNALERNHIKFESSLPADLILYSQPRSYRNEEEEYGIANSDTLKNMSHVKISSMVCATKSAFFLSFATSYIPLPFSSLTYSFLSFRRYFSTSSNKKKEKCVYIFVCMCAYVCV